MGFVVKQMKTVETLGSATVICSDKTGTLTENKMSLAKLFTLESQKITDANEKLNEKELALLRTALFASEPIPFDPMEVALHESYSRNNTIDSIFCFSDSPNAQTFIIASGAPLEAMILLLMPFSKTWVIIGGLPPIGYS